MKTKRVVKSEPATSNSKITSNRFFYKTPPSKLPRNFKHLQEVDKVLDSLLTPSLRRSYYISLDSSNSNKNNNNNNNVLSEYSECIDKLKDLLSIHVRWDLHSTFISDVVSYKHVNGYLSFTDYQDIEDYVLSTAHMLSSMLELYYKNTLNRTRVHKSPIRLACLWFARHLHRMTSKGALGVMYS
ncbi:MAG: hypothetical protein GY861_08060, partial [bacterium]|nr:hypothetical protein [bacterium]